MIFAGGQDGAVRAFDADTGQVRWTAYTGGAITYPPTLWQGRAYVGSGDGWVYCLAATTGRRLWRFRAAPAERIDSRLRIAPLDVAGGQRRAGRRRSGLRGGRDRQPRRHARAGAGCPDRQLRWHNHTSGALDPQTSSGVSVNGHLLLHGGQLHLAGGNMVPVASYDLADGRCVTDPSAPNSHTQFTAGSDLFRGRRARAVGRPAAVLRGAGDYRMVNQAILQTPVGDLVFAYGPHDGRLALFPASTNRRTGAMPLWQAQPLNRILGLAVAGNAVVAAGLRIPRSRRSPRRRRSWP